MSDGAATLTSDSGASSTPATPAAPPSTQSIAADVIETAEREDSGGSESYAETPRIDTTNTVAETTAPKTQPTPAELSAAAKFLEQQGHKLKKEDGRDVWLPAKTVEKMLDRYADTHKSTWTGEKTAIEARAKEYESHVQSIKAAIAGDETAFLKELASVDPRYARFLEARSEAQRVPEAANDPMPQPDYDLGNGQRTYSLEGLQKRDEWLERQMLRKFEGKIEERFKPIAEREKAEQARAAQERQLGEIRERTNSQLQEAQTWPLFGPMAADGSLTEFQQAVLEELKTDSDAAKASGARPKLTLEGAYIRVASKRMTEDDTAKRARLLKEIEKAPKGNPALSRQTADASAKPAGARSTADIARSVIGKLENA